MSESGPQTPFSQYLHATKYRAPNESFHEAMNRIASALTEGRENFKALREILEAMRFMPGGRIQAAVGAPKKVTPYNCFVSGEIHDSFLEGHGSIMARAAEAAATMRMGGGIGYDFSRLRPRGAPIKKLGSVSSGPGGVHGHLRRDLPLYRQLRPPPWCPDGRAPRGPPGHRGVHPQPSRTRTGCAASTSRSA